MMLILLLFAAGGASSSGGTGVDAGVVVREVAGEPGAVEGAVIVGAGSSVVAAALSDVPRWPAIFSDIRSARRAGRRGAAHEVVEVESQLLGHRHEFRVERRQGVVRLKLLDGHGFAMQTTFSIQAVDDRTSRVTARVALNATGILGWFRSKRSLLEIATRKVRTDLKDLKRAFPPS